RGAAALRRDLRGLPVRDPAHHARLQPGAGCRSDDDPHLPAVVLEQPVRLRCRGVDAADARDVRVGDLLVPALQARPGGHMSARLVNRGLDVLTWLVLLLMLSPIIWLVLSSLQTDGQLSTGAYNLLDPTLTAFTRMWQT